MIDKEKELEQFNKEQEILRKFKEKFGEPKNLLETSRAIHLAFSEGEKSMDKEIFPKKKGYIIFDEDQYFKRKKEIEEETLAEVGKVIGDFFNEEKYTTEQDLDGEDFIRIYWKDIEELKKELGI